MSTPEKTNSGEQPTNQPTNQPTLEQKRLEYLDIMIDAHKKLDDWKQDLLIARNEHEAVKETLSLERIKTEKLKQVYLCLKIYESQATLPYRFEQATKLGFPFEYKKQIIARNLWKMQDIINQMMKALESGKL